MPIYPYAHDCGATWDAVKPVADIDKPELCPHCMGARQVAAYGQRQIARVNFNGAADWNCQSFNPALGCYTRSTAHARQIAKSRGMEEVGNEPPEKIHAKMDKDREETRQRRWADADREKVYE